MPSFFLQFQQSPPNVQIPHGSPRIRKAAALCMDKIAALKEILALDANNSFARYGLAMELAGRGQVNQALEEFDTLLKNDPDYTAGYFMAAQTLANAGRNPAAITRLKEGIASAAKTGNTHAMSEMQGMLDELDR